MKTRSASSGSLSTDSSKLPGNGTQRCIAFSLKSSLNDRCLYVSRTSTGFLLIFLYVDDLLITGNNKAEITSIKGELSARLEMKDLGKAKVMLRIEIKRDRPNRKLFINQAEYTNVVLELFGMERSKPVTTPMEKHGIITTSNSPQLDKSIPCRSAVGSLMYLMVATRLDLAFAIGKVSRHAESPREVHWTAVKRVLCYVSGTRDFGILYEVSKPGGAVGCFNADWDGCKDLGKSTSGNLFLVSSGAVSWRSKKQTCVAMSTCESEYIAICLAAKEAIWISRLPADMHCTDKTVPITIGVDNNGATDTAHNDTTNRRNKHIDLAYHFVRDCTASKKINLQHCDSSEQLADSLNKPLDRVQLENLRILQGVQGPTF